MYSAPWIRQPVAAGCTRVIVDGCVVDPLNAVRLRIDGTETAPQQAGGETLVFLVPPLLAGSRLEALQGQGQTPR